MKALDFGTSWEKEERANAAADANVRYLTGVYRVMAMCADICTHFNVGGGLLRL